MQESTFSTHTPVPAEPVAHAEAAETENEEFLTCEIVQLWETHRSMHCSVKETHKEMRAIGKTLGEALFQMKRLLAKPGRAGGWSSFLKEKNIPRTTADRHVAAHERALNPGPNCTDGSIPESAEQAARKVFVALWPRLGRILTTGESVYYFVSALASAPCAGPCFQIREDGIFIPKPASKSTSQQRDDATAIADMHPEVAGAEADAKHATASLLVDDPRFAGQAGAEPCDRAEMAPA